MKVIKIGGNVIDNPEALKQFQQDFSRIDGPKVLIHGGGKIATRLSEKLGIETKMVGGRRITDKETLDVVTMVYAGLINKQMVAALQALGCNAIGLCGADANVIEAHKRITKDIDYGFVGDVDKANAEQLIKLTQSGFTPVLCAITHDRKGTLLNTNADTIAAETAKSLASLTEVEMIFCFEKDGVLSDPHDDASVIKKIDSALYENLKTNGTISGGMLPKLENAFSLLRAGVKKVIITSPKYLANPTVKHTLVIL